MFLIQTVYLVADELALVEDEQRIRRQEREKVGGILQHGQHKVGGRSALNVGGDRRHARIRSGGGRFFRHSAHHLRHALPFPFAVHGVRRRNDVDAGQKRIALPRHFVVRLDALHFVAEKIDAHGMLAVDGIDVEHVSPHGKHALALGRGVADITRLGQRADERAHIRLSSRLQLKYGEPFGDELADGLHIAHQDLRARLPLIEGGEAAEERLARACPAEGEHFVLGRKKRDLLSREDGNALLCALCRERVRRKIDDAPRKERGYEIFLCVGDPEHGGRHAAVHRRRQKRIVSVQIFCLKKIPHPLYLFMTRSSRSPFASATAASAARRQAPEKRS